MRLINAFVGATFLLISSPFLQAQSADCAVCTLINPEGSNINLKKGQRICLKDNYTWSGNFFATEGGELCIEEGAKWNIIAEDYRIEKITIHNSGTID